MYMSALPVYLWATCMPMEIRESVGSLELKLQTAVGYRVGTENHAGSSERAARALTDWIISLPPNLFIFFFPFWNRASSPPGQFPCFLYSGQQGSPITSRN